MDELTKQLKEAWNNFNRVEEPPIQESAQDGIVVDIQVGLTAFPRFAQVISSLQESISDLGLQVSWEKPKGFIKGLGKAEFKVYIEGPKEVLDKYRSSIEEFINGNLGQ